MPNEAAKIPATMRAVRLNGFGDASVLTVESLPVPQPAIGELLIRVTAAGMNRGDVSQRQGRYAPPPGISDTMGLEVSGTVAATGANTSANTGAWKVGDQVCALLAGGGYAEYCVVPAAQCLPVPVGVSLLDAASLPETYFTVWDAVWRQARLAAGESLLVHGGSSGIGVTAIQIAAALGHRVLVTAGSAEKCAACVALGATAAFNYRSDDFVERIKAATNGRGVDVVLDMVGGDYVPRNLQSLAEYGRLVFIASLGGAESKFNIRDLMFKRLTMFGTTLRSRSIDYKAQIAQDLQQRIWPLFGSGILRPVVHRVFPFSEVAQAHRLMESSAHIGKILLTP